MERARETLVQSRRWRREEGSPEDGGRTRKASGRHKEEHGGDAGERDMGTGSPEKAVVPGFSRRDMQREEEARRATREAKEEHQWVGEGKWSLGGELQWSSKGLPHVSRRSRDREISIETRESEGVQRGSGARSERLQRHHVSRVRLPDPADSLQWRQGSGEDRWHQEARPRGADRGPGRTTSHKKAAREELLYAVRRYHPVQMGSIDGTDTRPHDRGIKRAMVAWEMQRTQRSQGADALGEAGPISRQTEKEESFQARGEKEGPCSRAQKVSEGEADRMSRTVFLARLHWNCTEADVRSAAERHGEVKSVQLVRNPVTGAPRGYAFVEFSRERGRHRALASGCMEHLEPAPGWQSGVLVDFPRSRMMEGWVPRRLGGGLGGRKQSGQLRFGGPDRPFRVPRREVPASELKALGIPVPPGCFSASPVP